MLTKKQRRNLVAIEELARDLGAANRLGIVIRKLAGELLSHDDELSRKRAARKAHADRFNRRVAAQIRKRNGIDCVKCGAGSGQAVPEQIDDDGRCRFCGAKEL